MVKMPPNSTKPEARGLPNSLQPAAYRPASIADQPDVQDLIRRALAEDVGSGDVTTLSVVPEQARGRAVILARSACVVAGGTVACAVFRQVEPALACDIRVPDGAAARPDDVLLTVSGPIRGILTGERVALNFMQRLTGIATRTRDFVDRVRAHHVRILDTRKTTPTLRILEKYAVTCGGGTNHRMGLYDMVLIKDNHRRLWQQAGISNLAGAVAAARARFPGVPVEVEVESEDELHDALRAAPEWILLDNMTPERLSRCVAINAGRARLEASGGVTLATVEAIAATGVDAISIGGLTHSAPAADLSLELVE
jgi:nicotinate-nucleotide pyrophosphorylase (carboxylating)